MILETINIQSGNFRKLLQIEASDPLNPPSTDWIIGTSRVWLNSGGTLGIIDVNSGKYTYLAGSIRTQTNINDISFVNYPYFSPSREWLLFNGTYASNEPRWYIINSSNTELAKLGANIYPQDVSCGSLARLGRWNGAWSSSGYYLLCGCVRAGVNHACIFDLEGNVAFETSSETSSAEWAP